MTDSDKRPFLDELKRLGIAYGRDVDTVIASVYFEALADLSFDTLRPAMRATIQQMTFFPKPADLRDAEFAERARRDMEAKAKLVAHAIAEREQEYLASHAWQPPFTPDWDRIGALWAELRRIARTTPMKPHGPMGGGVCHCADCQRQRAHV
jgi:hypothetical protein